MFEVKSASALRPVLDRRVIVLGDASMCGVILGSFGTPSKGDVFSPGESNQKEDFFMKLNTIIAASALAISSATAFAQSPPAGAAADPNMKQNAQPAAPATNPSAPAPAAAPAAPSPAGTGDAAAPASEGASTGESGSSAPAGIPADPNTKQNVQPGPSTITPDDPAAGNNPDARAPTAP